MNTQTFLGFDFGTKRIGVAVGQTLTHTARPLATLAADKGTLTNSARAQLDKMLTTWQPDALVVGIPLNMDGSEQTVTQRARTFARWLADYTQLRVYEIDERLTTRAAREQIFSEGGFRALQKAEVDSFAAQIILQNWLITRIDDNIADE